MQETQILICEADVGLNICPECLGFLFFQARLLITRLQAYSEVGLTIPSYWSRNGEEWKQLLSFQISLLSLNSGYLDAFL